LTVEEKVQAVLIADGGVTALVSASSIKVGLVGQALAPPYISHFPVVNDENRTHEGRVKLQEWKSYQVDCVAMSYSGARAIVVAVIAALGSYRSGIITTSVRQGPYANDPLNTGAFKIPVLFDFADVL